MLRNTTAPEANYIFMFMSVPPRLDYFIFSGHATFRNKTAHAEPSLLLQIHTNGINKLNRNTQNLQLRWFVPIYDVVTGSDQQ